MRKYCTLIICVIFVLTVTCTLDLEDPRDPESPNYQGFETVKDINDITILDSLFGIYTGSLMVNECSSASEYQAQFSVTESFDDILYDIISLDNEIHVLAENINSRYGYFRVRAIDSEGHNGDWTDVRFVDSRFSFDIPLAYGNFSSSDTTPTLEWEPLKGAEEYEIQIADSIENLDNSELILCETTSYEPAESFMNFAYTYWRVRAIDSQGNASCWSSVQKIHIQWDGPRILSPDGREFSSDTRPVYSWAPDNYADHYELCISGIWNMESPQYFVTTSTSFALPYSIVINELLYWGVRSVDSNGITSSWKSEYYQILWGDIENLFPGKDSGLRNTGPQFSWDAVDGADHYEFQKAFSSDTIETANIEILSDNYYTLMDNLSEGTSLFWRVRAVNPEGQCGNWSITRETIETEINMLTIPGGSFIMGDTWGVNLSESELPTHEVILSDFYMAETELTIAQFGEVYDWAIENGYEFREYIGHHNYSGKLNRPIGNISWLDAIIWCNAASEYMGYTPVYLFHNSIIRSMEILSGDYNNIEVLWTANGYRLPTESEWEYAARGGQDDSDDSMGAGDDNLDNIAWYNGSYMDVAGKAPNELGLYDMTGNVFEWCWDWFGPYEESILIDPRGPSSGSAHVVRGGSIYSDPSDCWIFRRFHYSSLYSHSSKGLRLVRSNL